MCSSLSDGDLADLLTLAISGEVLPDLYDVSKSDDSDDNENHGCDLGFDDNLSDLLPDNQLPYNEQLMRPSKCSAQRRHKILISVILS